MQITRGLKIVQSKVLMISKSSPSISIERKKGSSGLFGFTKLLTG
jgi:hypothetical protein